MSKVYFIGCDMGGWHTKKTDALAWCAMHDDKWVEDNHTQSGQLFLPDDSNPLRDVIKKALEEEAQVVVAVDASLGWPQAFCEWVKAKAMSGSIPRFNVEDGELRNPLLYRATERFIKDKTGQKPASAVKDQLGSNFTKGQVLAAWVRKNWKAYCPPFDADSDDAAKKQVTVIEVYPAASLKCKAFLNLDWPEKMAMGKLGKSDIADAQRAAMTAACYAKTIGMIGRSGLPNVYLPADAGDEQQDAIRAEGWIFCPKNESKA